MAAASARVQTPAAPARPPCLHHSSLNAVTGPPTRASFPATPACPRHGADRLAKQLSRAGIDAAAIHGDRNQELAADGPDKGMQASSIAGVTPKTPPTGAGGPARTVPLASGAFSCVGPGCGHDRLPGLPLKRTRAWCSG